MRNVHSACRNGRAWREGCAVSRSPAPSPPEGTRACTSLSGRPSAFPFDHAQGARIRFLFTPLPTAMLSAVAARAVLGLYPAARYGLAEQFFRRRYGYGAPDPALERRDVSAADDALPLGRRHGEPSGLEH